MNVGASDDFAKIFEVNQFGAVFVVPLKNFVDHLLQLGVAQIAAYHHLQGLAITESEVYIHYIVEQ